MKILLEMQQQNTSPTLTVAYSESSWWPSGHYFTLKDQDTGSTLIASSDFSRTPQKIAVTLGQKLYIEHSEYSGSIGHPDRVTGTFVVENSTGVVFTNIPSGVVVDGATDNLEFYITEAVALFTFRYG